MSRPESLPTSSARNKSVLFCQDCGHENPVEGDWRIGRRALGTSLEQVAYRCPDCGHVLTVRPVERTVWDVCSGEVVPVGLWYFSASLTVLEPC